MYITEFVSTIINKVLRSPFRGYARDAVFLAGAKRLQADSSSPHHLSLIKLTSDTSTGSRSVSPPIVGWPYDRTPFAGNRIIVYHPYIHTWLSNTQPILAEQLRTRSARLVDLSVNLVRLHPPKSTSQIHVAPDINNDPLLSSSSSFDCFQTRDPQVQSISRHHDQHFSSSHGG